MSKINLLVVIVIVVVVVVVVVRLLKPLQEWFTGFANFLARLFIYVLLAYVGSPLFDNPLVQNINLVELHENLGNEGDQIGVILPKETLETAQQSLLVFFRSHHL